MSAPLGYPRVHLRSTDSTNERARALAVTGAPSGTLVTAAEQSAGRGRQGRTWWAPAGSSLLLSLLIRDPPRLLPLMGGVAVCDVAGERAAVKWPNDVVLRGPCVAETALSEAQPDAPAQAGGPPLAKLAGILVEGRPQENWAVLGIGVNVAVRPDEMPGELSTTAASLSLPASEIESLLDRLLRALARRLREPEQDVLDAWRARDALQGREIAWEGPDAQGTGMREQSGCADGIDEHGHLRVRLDDGRSVTLSAGEVHLRPAA